MTEQQNKRNENMSGDRCMLTGMFRDREKIENICSTMQERGYSKDDLNLMSDETSEIRLSIGN